MPTPNNEHEEGALPSDIGIALRTHFFVVVGIFFLSSLFFCHHKQERRKISSIVLIMLSCSFLIVSCKPISSTRLTPTPNSTTRTPLSTQKPSSTLANSASSTLTPYPMVGNKSPVIIITNPVTGTTFSVNHIVTLAASASDSDGTIAQVTFFANGMPIAGCADTTAPYECAWTPVQSGFYNLTAQATDNKSTVTESAASSVTISDLANQPPMIALISPVNGVIVPPNQVVVLVASADDVDGSITKVMFFANSIPIANCFFTTAPYECSWTPTAPGAYSLTAQATDKYGAVTTTPAIVIMVNPPITPVVTQSSPLIPTPTPKSSPTPNISIPTLSVAEMFDKELKKLSQGSFLFNPPNEMTVGESERVEVRIQKGITVTVGISGTPALASGLLGNGVPTIEPIRVGTFMDAKLSGEYFKISPLTAEEQILGDDGYTQWEWDISPLQSGTLKLNLVVSVRIKIPDGGEETKTYAVKDKVVTVSVNPVYSGREFVANSWQWLLIIIAGIVLGWLIVKRKPETVTNVNMGGGTYVGGDVDTKGDFVGRDKTEHTGDES